MKVCLVCNGSITDYNLIKKYVEECDYIISVDGGARHLRQMGIAPHILLGDFDSAHSKDLKYFNEMGIKVSQFPVEKDMTDSELAIHKAIEAGADEIIIVGALGGARFDHSIANILLLKKLSDSGIKACIINENNLIYMFNSTFSIKREEGYFLSLIPVSGTVTGVSTSGLKYKLDNAEMNVGTSWGISNEFVEETATVTIADGTLLVCLSKD